MARQFKISDLKVEVVHQNCRYNCKHCFISVDNPATDKAAKSVANKLVEKGYTVSFWTSAMEKEGALDLQNEYGNWRSPNGGPDCSIELRDSLPHFMEEAPEGARFGFSLHGHTPELHNLLVRGQGNFEKVVESLKEASQRNLQNIYVHHVVHKENYKHLEEFCELMLSLKVPIFYITKLVGSTLAVKNVPELLMMPEEIHDVVRQGNYLREKYRGRMIVALSQYGFGALFTERRYKLLKALCAISPVQMRHHCDAGKDLLAISARTKKVYPCRFFLNAEACEVGEMDDDGNLILDRPNWKEDFSKNVRKIDEPCRSCGILKWCGGGCRATAMAEHNQIVGGWNAYAGLKSCPVAGRVFMEY